MSDQPSIVWFRQDLRLDDHAPLRAALERKAPIIPVYIWAPDEEEAWLPGAASRWWLHQSLESLQGEIEHKGGRLIIRKGGTLQILRSLIDETNARAVYWNRRYEPAAVKRDAKIKSALREAGILAESFNGSLLYEPWEIRSKSDAPYRVFTPFSHALFARGDLPACLPMPRHLPEPYAWPNSLKLSELGLEPNVDWASGMREAWEPGRTGAHKELKRFLKQALVDYRAGRERPAEPGTSRLSPHLHFGEISPRQVWDAVSDHAVRFGLESDKVEVYLRQLIWRDFAAHLLYHFPRTAESPLRVEFEAFPWHEERRLLLAWQRGMTGYPIVDAGMRQLWSTGWMHNRVRMVAASFLVKDLLIPWQSGARWFWDTLVDADLANNTLGWQWVAGCGADAAPYFRIFNPVSQGEKFDPDGAYVRRWVPELEKLPSDWIHAPWTAPVLELKRAGIVLGKTYPEPIVDHAWARKRALVALASIRKG